MNTQNIANLLELVTDYKRSQSKPIIHLNDYSLSIGEFEFLNKSRTTNKNAITIDLEDHTAFITIPRIHNIKELKLPQKFRKYLSDDLQEETSVEKLKQDLFLKEQMLQKAGLYQEYIAWSAEVAEYLPIKKEFDSYSEFYNQFYLAHTQIYEDDLQLYFGIGNIIGLHESQAYHHPLFSYPMAIQLDSSGLIRLSIDIERQIFNRHLLDNANSSLSYIFTEIRKMIEGTEIEPLDNHSYTPLLETLVSHLGANSQVIRPNENNYLNLLSELQKQENFNILTNWAIYVGKRDDHFFFSDIEKTIESLSSSQELTTALTSMFVADNTKSLDVLHGFSHLETDYSKVYSAKPLLFPLPYNIEQEKIVKNLLAYGKCVVQGPPGTGKTHAITNVVAHFLANKKTILFTSKGEDAIRALEEKLPSFIKKYSLIIKNLSSQDEIREQTENFAKNVLTVLDENKRHPDIYKVVLNKLEPEMAIHQKRMTQINHKMNSRLAAEQRTVVFQGEEYSIAQAFEWVESHPVPDLDYSVQLSDSDLEGLKVVAESDFFNNTNVLAELDYNDFFQGIENHSFFNLTPDYLESFQHILTQYQTLSVQPFIKEAKTLALNKEWVGSVTELQQILTDNNIFYNEDIFLKFYHRFNGDSNKVFSQLVTDLNKIVIESQSFLGKNFDIPSLDLLKGIYKKDFEALKEGKKLGGLFDSFIKKKQIEFFSQITINTKQIYSQEGWLLLDKYINTKDKLKEKVSSWNSLAHLFGFDSIKGLNIEDEVSEILKKVKLFYTIQKMLKEVLAESFINTDNPLSDFKCVETNLQNVFTLYKLQIQMNDMDTFVHSEGKKIINKGQKEQYFLWLSSYQFDNLTTLLSEITNRESRIREGIPFYQNIYHTLENQSKTLQSFLKTLMSKGLTIESDILLEQIKKNVLTKFLSSVATEDFSLLLVEKRDLENRLHDIVEAIVENNIQQNLVEAFSNHKYLTSLQAIQTLLRKIGKGTGKKAKTYLKNLSIELNNIRDKTPLMAMPHDQVPFYFLGASSIFDLVVIDEASQSELVHLNILNKGKNILIVGDDKQVSPEVVFNHDTFESIKKKYLQDLPSSLSAIIAEDCSLYDIANTTMISQQVKMREHFRCHPAIIEFSNKMYYEGEIRCMRQADNSIPLIDVLIKTGQRDGKRNFGEAKYIIEEIKALTETPDFFKTIGVVSLLGDEQANYIRDQLINTLGAQIMQKHQITIGTSKKMQGKERDIVFLSLVVSPENNSPATRISDNQRFNVAASRAKETMYLVRSVEISDLSSKDTNRIALISHFNNPFPLKSKSVQDLRELCESPFEREFYDFLVARNYKVVPQVEHGGYRLDLVVYGANSKLAIECDGDTYHNEFNFLDDMKRQSILERCGWIFWRSLYSQFAMNKEKVFTSLIAALEKNQVYPQTEVVNDKVCYTRKIVIEK